ncbi:M28 family peptidase [Glacieibacterium frigidum]|uniref:M28 family peptidase n=1 Tax=Glacieibacterium frigidum TaxID=2593303 RepID=A0A552UIX1_9SPHN|nr:M28 family peptidase [Glacieibacterium frigidum]TRW18168.1 M28 family peptidase [Glacieibacterium frigidum]
MLIALTAAVALAAAPVSPARIKEHVRVLSSDAFAGRGPGEAGEAKTIAYLSKAFAAAGFEPGGENGGWTQAVPLVRLDRQPGATMSLGFGGKVRPLALGRDATLAFRTPGRTELTNAPLVFAGFGVVDAKRGWDAYAGVDMAGKVALILANDPDFEGGRDLGFDGRRMALAGRFGSKVEAALRAGAVAVLVIHEAAAASYPFTQVGSGDALPQMVSAPGPTPSALKASGWLSLETATALLASGGFDLAALKTRARDPGFRALALPGATLSLDGTLRATPVISHNVIGRLPGAVRPAETVLYGAHWDANGTNGPDAKGDAIRNGAIDNATGTAELIEVARAFGQGKRPARSIVVAAWTAEEKGLLGADYYVRHPLYPLATTALVINLDPHVVLPAARNIELIGGGRTPVEGDLTRVAAARGLRVDPEPEPEAGWYFRSDHYPFARAGVPAIAFRAGRDLKVGGVKAGQRSVAAYNQSRYHQPSDAFDARWTFAGTLQEATVAFDLGVEVANGTAWPGWNAGVDYGVVRAATAAERK